MEMLKNKKNLLYTVIIICLGIIISASINCDSLTGPDDITLEAIITVNNKCGLMVDIFMDGVYRFTLQHQASNTIKNIANGTHELVAKRTGTEIVVSSASSEITEVIEYIWNVLTSANLSIKNEYGEPLKIYANGNLQGEVNDQKTLTVQSIPYGEHLFEAQKSSDSTKVASLTINITENKVYFWTISD